MEREDQEVALRWACREEHLAITHHARIEMSLEGVTTDDVIAAGTDVEVVEEDRSRTQGTTKVLLGYVPADGNRRRHPGQGPTRTRHPQPTINSKTET